MWGWALCCCIACANISRHKMKISFSCVKPNTYSMSQAAALLLPRQLEAFREVAAEAHHATRLVHLIATLFQAKAIILPRQVSSQGCLSWMWASQDWYWYTYWYWCWFGIGNGFGTCIGIGIGSGTGINLILKRIYKN